MHKFSRISTLPHFGCSIAWLALVVLAYSSTFGRERGDDLARPPANVGEDFPPAPQSPLQLAGKLDLASLLDLASATSGISIDYDPDMLKGQSLTLRAGQPVTPDQLWALIHRALAQRNLVLIAPPFAAIGQHSNLRLVLPPPATAPASTTSIPHAGFPPLSLCRAEDASKQARTEPLFDLGVTPSTTPLHTRAALVIQPVRLAHITASDALRVLKARARVSASAAGDEPRTITLTDQTARVNEALALLREVDIPSAAIVIEPFAPQHQSAADLLAKVSQLRGGTAGARSNSEQLAHTSSTTPSGEVSLAPGNASLLVIAPVGEQAAWRTLLLKLDAPEVLTTTTYSPRGTSAAEAAALLVRSLNIPLATNEATSISITPAPSPAAAPAVRADPSTGSVTLTATAREQAAAKALLDALAQDPMVARPMRVLPVRNRPVAELVGTLERLVAAGAIDPAPASRSPNPNAPNYAPIPGSLTPIAPGQAAATADARSAFPLGGAAARGIGASSTSAGLSITADTPTSSIIALGDARQLDQLAALLKTLDVRQPQVMLEAIIVTLSDSDSLSLGVELERLRVDGDIRTRLASLFGLSTPSTINNQPSRDAGQASGFTGVLLNPGDFSLVVRAVQSISEGRTLSLPRVLVTSNQEASFNSVVQQPFAASFTAGNSSTPTTSFGGTQDAGTQLSIKPQVGEGETLLLEYSISISSFVGAAASSSLPPPRQVTSVQSQAIVPDGFSVVVGGLEVTSDGTSESRVPGIGDVPVLGELFKSRTRGTSRSRFFVFIRASVLRDESLTALRTTSDRSASDAGLPKLTPESWPIGSAPGTGTPADTKATPSALPHADSTPANSLPAGATNAGAPETTP